MHLRTKTARFIALITAFIFAQSALAQNTAPPDTSQRAGGSGDVVLQDQGTDQTAQDPAETPRTSPDDGDAAQEENKPPPQQSTNSGNNGAQGTDAEPLPDAMRSPRGMVELFLSEAETALRHRESEQTTLLKYLPQKSRDAFDNAGLRDARRLAEVLLELRDRSNSAYLRLWELSYDEQGSIAHLNLNVRSIEGETVEDRKLPLVLGSKGYWRFSEEAIVMGGRMHALLFPDSYILRSFFEDAGMSVLVDTEILGIGLYQWIALAALILLAWLLDLVVALVSLWAIRRYLKKDEDTRTPGDSAKLVKKASKPFGLAAAGALLYFAIPELDLPVQAEGILRVAAQIFLLFGLFLALSRVIDLVGEFFHRRSLRTSTKFDDLLVPLLRKTAKTVLFALALLTVAESLSLPVTSLVAGFGIAGAAIAFASKDTVENLFGSVAVILDRPFNAGDYVEIDGIEGSVEHLGFRSTRIRTFYNSIVTVPNALLVRAKVDNYGVRKYRRYKTALSLLYSTPPDRIEAFVEGLRELVRNHPDTRKDFIEIHFRDYGAHSLDIMMWIFFRVPDWTAENIARHRLNLDILRLAKRIGVEFAFPTQTLELRRAGELQEPGPALDAEAARQDGIEAVTSMRQSALLD